jgi:hypothetical protein
MTLPWASIAQRLTRQKPSVLAYPGGGDSGRSKAAT